jgi:hypothetical protein
MFNITGKLISRTLLKSGTNSFGTWRVIQFVVEKQYKGEKKKIPFIATGKNADFVNGINNKERVAVSFFPNSREHNNRLYVELKVISVEKDIKKKKWYNQIDAIEGKGDFASTVKMDFGDNNFGD